VLVCVSRLVGGAIAPGNVIPAQFAVAAASSRRTCRTVLIALEMNPLQSPAASRSASRRHFRQHPDLGELGRHCLDPVDLRGEDRSLLLTHLGDPPTAVARFQRCSRTRMYSERIIDLSEQAKLLLAACSQA
jgi:hypothetical protein